MNKTDFNKLMEEEIINLKFRPTLLLHACCAPCSSSVLERLNDFFNITVFFYNPNMDTKQEYEKRKEEAIGLIEKLNKKNKNKIEIVTIDYNHNEYLDHVKGFENEKEGGDRCYKCFYLRLKKTCEFAKQNDFN